MNAALASFWAGPDETKADDSAKRREYDRAREAQKREMASRLREVQEAQLNGREAMLRDREAKLRGMEATLREREATLMDQEAMLRDLEAKPRNHETSCVPGTSEGRVGTFALLGLGLLVVGGAIHTVVQSDSERTEDQRRPQNEVDATWESGVYDGSDGSGYMLPRKLIHILCDWGILLLRATVRRGGHRRM